MFKNISFPLVSNKIKTPFTEEISMGLSWEELASRGYLKEDIEVNDDVVIMTKDFISLDQSVKRSDRIIIPRKDFDYFIKELDIEKFDDEIKKLEETIQNLLVTEEYEICTSLKDQVKFLKDFSNSVLLNDFK